MVRVFAGWLQGFDARTEVPPPGLISGKPRRTRPYIYTDDQIAEIVTEAGRLPSSYGLRGWTCSTLFGLIAVTGLRVSEALGLDDKDVDLNEAVLTIRHGKNGKSRFVPISACATERLRAYRAERNRILGAAEPRSSCSRMANARPTAAPATTSPWSASESAFASRSPSTNMAAARASTICDIPSRCARSWTGIGAASIRIARCSSSAPIWGTSKPEHTYWYIEAIPELLQLACERAERNLGEREAR